MGYEYLIAGFEDIALSERVQTSQEALLELLDEHLSASDKDLLALLRRKNDDEAILALRHHLLQSTTGSGGHANSPSSEDEHDQ